MSIEQVRATRLFGITPKNGYGGAVYSVDPPVAFSQGKSASFVVTSFGNETILGDGNTFAVFASDADGRVLDWEGIYSCGEGPAWCLELLNKG